MSSRLTSIVFISACCYLLTACGGGGAGGSSSSIGGAMNTARFTIPAGQTRTVSADLLVNASMGIEIDGTLAVPENVNVSLISDGPIVIKGAIVAADSKTAPAHLTRGGGPFSITICGGSGTSLGNVSAPNGTSINIAQNGDSGLVFGSITTPNGKKSTQPGVPGGDSASIDIGSAKAISMATSLGAKAAGQPTSITGTLVETGFGGEGYTDPGTDKGTYVLVSPTDGGNAGNISISAQSPTEIGKISANGGGDAGDCRILLTQPANEVGQKGQSIVTNMGNGGNGGSVSLAAANSTAPTAGVGGGCGLITIEPQVGGPGGNGGDATVTAGNAGASGSGGSLGTSMDGTAITVYAAGGGSSKDDEHNGGDAGTITVLGKNGGPVTVPRLTMTLWLAKGGDGFSGDCGVAGKQKATSGGNGGNVNTAGVTYEKKEAANGGAGGSGNPIGGGGNAGIDLTSQFSLGVPGLPGKPCSGIGATALTTYPVPGSNISFCTLDTATQCMIGMNNDIGTTTLSRVSLANGAVTSFSCSAAMTITSSSLCNSNVATRVKKPGSSTLFVASGVAHAILVLDETSGAQLGTIPIPNSGGPTALAFDPGTGRLYAGVDAGVDVFDTKNNNTLVGTIATLADPFSMALNPSNSRLYISTYGYVSGAQVAAEDLTSLTEIHNLTLPDSSGGLTVNPSTGYVYATLFNSSKVAVITADASSITTTLSVGTSPWGVSVDSKRNRVFVANYNYSQTNPQPGSVTELDGASNTVITTVTVGKGPTAISVDETADKIYVANATDSSISVLSGN